MNRKIIIFGGFLAVFLILITSSINGSIVVEKNNNSFVNSLKLDKSETSYMSNKNIVFIFGTIYNFTIDEPTKTYSFVCKNIWLLHNNEFVHITDHEEFINENLSFRGILIPWFVCGYFYW